MGRPKLLECKKQYTVILSPSIIQEVDYYCEQLGIKSRSDMMGRLIENGLECIDSLESLGIVRSANVEPIVYDKLKNLILLGGVVLDKSGNIKLRK